MVNKKKDKTYFQDITNLTQIPPERQNVDVILSKGYKTRLCLHCFRNNRS